MQQNQFFYITPSSARRQKTSRGLFTRLREAIINLTTEEAEPDRPIGISQLSKHTFQSTGQGIGSFQSGGLQPVTVYQEQRQMHDYRFNRLVNR